MTVVWSERSLEQVDVAQVGADHPGFRPLDSCGASHLPIALSLTYISRHP